MRSSRLVGAYVAVEVTEWVNYQFFVVAGKAGKTYNDYSSYVLLYPSKPYLSSLGCIDS
jgi:hypothetical protein